MRIRKQYLLEKYDLNEGIGSQIMAGLAAAAMGAVGAGDAPKQQKSNVRQASIQQISNQSEAPNFDEEIKKLIKHDEGVRTKMYSDTKGIQTVGVGHNLANEKASSAAFTKAFGKEGDKIRKSVLAGNPMTDEQVEKLFQVDYEDHKNRTANMIPDLQKYPSDVQGVLVSGTFRGHVGDSPNFRRLLAAGKFEEAAKELLNRDEYTSPKAIAGVKSRLERDANVIKQYGKDKPQLDKANEMTDDIAKARAISDIERPKPPVTTAKTSNKPKNRRTK